jgi:hypothetical protein
MPWLCRIFGHKHKLSLGDYDYLKEYCVRCHAVPQGGQDGDDVLRCKILGHRHKINIGDYQYSDNRFCYRCHDTV